MTLMASTWASTKLKSSPRTSRQTFKSPPGAPGKLNLMQHIELHVIESEEDIDLALQSGLLIPQHLDDIECSVCDELLGNTGTGDEFVGFAVVLDDDYVWTVCADCADPVIGGRAIEEILTN